MHINLTTRDVKLPNGVILKPYELAKLKKIRLGEYVMFQVPERYTVMYQEPDGASGHNDTMGATVYFLRETDVDGRYTVTYELLNDDSDISTARNALVYGKKTLSPDIGRGLTHLQPFHVDLTSVYPSTSHAAKSETSNFTLGEDYDCTPIVQSDFIKNLRSTLKSADYYRAKMRDALMYHSHVYGLNKEDHHALVDDYQDYVDNHEGVLEYALNPAPYAQLLMRHTRGRQV